MERRAFHFDFDLEVSSALLAGPKAELEVLDLRATLTFNLTSIEADGEVLDEPRPSFGTGTHCHSL